MRKNVHTLLFIACLILIQTKGHAQEFVRAGVFGSYDAEYIHGYSVDPMGDLVISGTFQMTVDLDFETGDQDPMTALSKYDIYVAKYDIVGNYKWSFHLGGDPNGYNYVNDVITDMDGNIFITGFSDGWIDFDPSDETDSIKGGEEAMIYLAKYNPDGEYLWAHGFGNNEHTKNNVAFGLALDSLDGSIYMVGELADTVDLDPSAGSTILVPGSGRKDIFLAKYSNNGDFQWAKQLSYPGAYGIGLPRKLRVDADRNVYMSGTYYGIIDMDPSVEVHPIGEIDKYDSDGFVAKYDKDGAYLWAMSLGGENEDYVRDIQVYNEKLYLVGDFMDTVDFDPSGEGFELSSIAMESSGFMAAYDLDGGFLSAMGIEGKQIDVNYSGSRAWGMDMDKRGDLYLVGSFYGEADFDPSEGTAIMGSTGGISDYDMFLAKYDSEMNYLWALHAGGNSQEQGYFACATNNGEIIAMGYYDGLCDFDPSDQEFVKDAKGSHDVYLAWYSAFSTVGLESDSGSGKDHISLYPNPVHSSLYLESNAVIDRVEVFSAGGSLLHVENVHQNRAAMELSGLARGAYIMRVFQETEVQNLKFVKVD